MPTLWCIQVNMKNSMILQKLSSTYPIVITSLYRKKRRNRRSCSHLNGTNYQRLDESKDQKTECAGGYQAQGPCFPWSPDPRLSGVGKPPWGNCEKGSEVHRKAKPSVWLSLQVRELNTLISISHSYVQDKLRVLLQHDTLRHPTLNSGSSNNKMPKRCG